MTKKFIKIRKDVNKILENVDSLNDVDFFDAENKRDFDCNMKSIATYLSEAKMIVARDEELKNMVKCVSESKRL